LAASAFHLGLHDCYGDAEATELAQQLPHFDARVISLPSQIEAANAMLWRTIDCRKNAVLAAAQAHFSHQQLDRKNQPELREMLAERGVDFETYPEAFKWGTWMRRVTFERPFTIADMANIPAEHRPAPDALVTRSEVRRSTWRSSCASKIAARLFLRERSPRHDRPRRADRFPQTRLSDRRRDC